MLFTMQTQRNKTFTMKPFDRLCRLSLKALMVVCLVSDKVHDLNKLSLTTAF